MFVLMLGKISVDGFPCESAEMKWEWLNWSVI